MRLLMVAHSDAPWTPHYARYFKARGDTVLVVTFAPNRIEGIDIVFVGIEPFDFRKNKRLFITRVPRVRRIIRDYRPDVVYAPYLASNGMTAVLSSGKTPIIVAARGGDVLEQAGRSGLRRRVREAMVRFVCRRAVLVHTVSPELDQELIRLGIPASKLVRIPVGVDVTKFHPDEGGPRADVTRLICVRKHEPIYDIPTIVKALAKLKTQGRRFHCTFAGGGTMLDQHKASAAALGLNDCVTFTGHVPHERLPDLLRQAGIYISASLSDGTASSLLEALATGILPVVSRIQANLPWIEDGRTGLLFEPGRPDDLAKALEKAMDDAEIRKSAFAANPARIDREANMKRNMDHLGKTFDKVVSQYAPTRR